ncbi:hypothetical protein QCA50_011399 [Cerrena zonata]|uniref:Uncharacterized protein n=1 Tax=Cerrena zonata TaxID=2478898 RepID=A0AAW0G205_9APHY
MYVPGISIPRQRIFPRKGGGAKGGGGGGKSGGGSRSGGSSSKGSSSSSSSKGGSSSSSGHSSAPVSVSGKSPKSGSTVSSFSNGGGRISTIPAGAAFAGRSQGGGSRADVYGSRTYGSGYPSAYGGVGRGVGGLGFPFFFWPVVWGGGLGYGGAYLYNHEYGNSDNPDRPGGPMTVANFASNTTNSTFHVLSDNTTVTALIETISTTCTGIAQNFSRVPVLLNTSDPSAPRAEQAIQYYRASSVVLTLDGYNDTTALQDNSTGPDVPIPSWADTTLLNCLNQTIGDSVPLVDAATTTTFSFASMSQSPAMGLLGLIWTLCFFMNML